MTKEFKISDSVVTFSWIILIITSIVIWNNWSLLVKESLIETFLLPSVCFVIIVFSYFQKI
jgi:hypothetical protein